ncbi:MAG: formyltransferase family protein [Nitrolancea sp.]
MSAESNTSLRVVLFTDIHPMVVPMMHQLLPAHGHNLVGVVTGPGPKSRRTDTYVEIVRSTPPDIDVIVTTHMKRLPDMLRSLDADLFWVMGFMRILPDDVINLPRLGTVNTHSAVLPRYRGPNPFGWCFRDEAGEIGWTIHRMTSVLDAGPILAQASVTYDDDDDFESITPRWLGALPGLLVEGLTRAAAGDPGDAQDESQASYAGFFEPEWRQIEWSRPSRAIHNQVRSWVGQRGVPRGAFGVIDGEQKLVVKTALMSTGSSATASPGDVIEHDGDTLVVQCGDGPLRILRWQANEAG